MTVAGISVCMATYQGERWVEEQLTSILAQLDTDDEVVIVDDASRDSTVALINRFGDRRIRLFSNDRNLGHVRTFERAISLSTGDSLLLADQDDVWLPGRVNILVEALSRRDVVASGFDILGIGSPPLPPQLPERGILFHTRNVVGIFLGKRAYFGCAMALNRRMLPVLVPFPPNVEAHDHWLAIVGNVAGQMEHVCAPTLLRRIHGDNATPNRRRSITRVIRTRLVLLRLIGASAMRLRGPRSAAIGREASVAVSQ